VVTVLALNFECFAPRGGWGGELVLDDPNQF